MKTKSLKPDLIIVSCLWLIILPSELFKYCQSMDVLIFMYLYYQDGEEQLL